MMKARVLFVLVLTLLLSSASFGQGRYGKDSSECVKFLNFYSDFVKQGNLAEAAPLWREAMKYCPPTSSRNLLINGVKIMKYLIAKETSNPERRQQLIDSLFQIYDMRLQYYPKYKATSQNLRAFDYNIYVRDNEAVYKEFLKTIDMLGNNISAEILVLGMKKSTDLLGEGKLTASEVMDFYTMAGAILENKQSAGEEGIEKIRQDFETLFVTSGVANCENLVALFTPKFESNKGDKEFVSKVVSLMNNAGCFKEELFLKAVEALNTIDPSYKTSYYLYKLYAYKEQHEEAMKFLKEAIDSDESCDTEDGEWMYEMATYYFSKLNNKVKAVEYAKEALKKNEAMAGKIYMLIGTIWSQNKCQGNDIEQRAHFWVAVDYFVKAKNADPSLAEEANEYIRSYAQYYPLQEEAFMFDILEGKPYTVSCGGLRENTTVKTRK